jgi:hypothetical protein
VCRASAVTRYVDVNCLTPVAPYTSWSQASTTIQVAIDASVAGDEIVVTNGIYNVGTKAVFGTMANRVAINKQVAVRSVNGPQFTIIQGRQLPGITNGDGAIRCVYLMAGASLNGFTLTGGATRSDGDWNNELSGGGIWCDTTSNPLVTNCVITGNTATGNGGGSFYGTLINCTLTNNWTTANGGGASGGTLTGCLVSFNSALRGGGVHYATLNNCIITANIATDSGGGVDSGTINNSVLSANTAFNQGGGAGGTSLLRQCTVTHNLANFGGGLYNGSATNCILYFNTANRDGADQYASTVAYCCIATPPDPSYRSTGIITANPHLADSAQRAARA